LHISAGSGNIIANTLPVWLRQKVKYSFISVSKFKMDRRVSDPRRRFLLASLAPGVAGLIAACAREPKSQVNQIINTGTASDTFEAVSSRMAGAPADRVFLRDLEVYGRRSAPWRLLDTSVESGPNPYERSEALVSVLGQEKHEPTEGLWRGYMVLPEQPSYSFLVQSISVGRADELIGKTRVAEEDADRRVFKVRVGAFSRGIDARALLRNAGYALALERVDPQSGHEPIIGTARVFALAPKSPSKPSLL
jgi:hypothetical protein